jgi:hypothetical protein
VPDAEASDENEVDPSKVSKGFNVDYMSWLFLNLKFFYVLLPAL